VIQKETDNFSVVKPCHRC